MVGHVAGDNLLHPLFQLLNQLQCHRGRIPVGRRECQLKEIAFRYRGFHHQLTVGIEVAHGLVKHKRQRAHVHLTAGSAVEVQELYRLRTKHTEAKTFQAVVHQRTYGLVGKLQAEGIIYLGQHRAELKRACLAVILAFDLYHGLLFLCFAISSMVLGIKLQKNIHFSPLS